MYLVGLLCFLTLEKWPFVGNILCVLHHAPLCQQSYVLSSCLLCELYESFLVADYVSGLIGMAGSWSSWLTYAEVVSCWLLEPDHGVADC